MITEGLSDVQKLVHLAYRMDMVDKAALKTALFREMRFAYEDEITIQARRVGCAGIQGRVSDGMVLDALNEMATTQAQGIIETYNRDLVYALRAIRSDAPRANRHVYANRLGTWEQRRDKWKIPQIAQYTQSSVRSLAQQHFHRYNNSIGMAILRPSAAVCPVCQGWVARGEVPLRVALNNPPPYHPNCCPAGVLVQMTNGDQKPIQGVVAGDEVLTRNGSCRVIQAFRRYATEPVYRIFVCGRVLRVTGDHPILTETGWRLAQELQAGDKILLVKDHEHCFGGM